VHFKTVQWLLACCGCIEHKNRRFNFFQLQSNGKLMNSIVYIIGLVVIVIAAMSFFGFR